MLINAAQSGNCSDDDVFATYASQSSRDAQIAQTKDNNATLEDSGVPTSPVLFGPNWSINAPATAVTYLRAALGGIVVGG